MKQQSTFTKIFLFTAVGTAACWALAWGSSKLAGDETFPSSTLAKLEDQLNKETIEVHETKNIAIATVEGLSVELGSTDLDVEGTKGSEFQAELTGSGVKGTEIRTEQKNGQVVIRVENQNATHWNFSKGITINNGLRLRLKVPESYGRGLSLKTGSGDITSSDLAVDRLDIKVGSGEINVSGIKAKSADARSGSGEIVLNKVAVDDLKLSAGSGSITVEELISKNAQATTGSGDVQIKLHDYKNWTATARAGSGEIDADLPNVERTERPNMVKVGSGPSKLEVQTGSGDISILQ